MVQSTSVLCLVSLNDIQDLVTGQLWTVIEAREVQHRVKYILASHRSLKHLYNPGAKAF